MLKNNVAKLRRNLSTMMLVCTLTGNLRTYIVWLWRYNFQVISKVDMQLECWEVMLFNFFAYFKFHSNWGRVIGKIKKSELDCHDTAPLNKMYLQCANWEFSVDILWSLWTYQCELIVWTACNYSVHLAIQFIIVRCLCIDHSSLVETKTSTEENIFFKKQNLVYMLIKMHYR